MSPATMQSSLRSASKTARCGQPAQAAGGLPGGGGGSGRVRRRRGCAARAPTFSSPKRNISGLPSTAMPAARIGSARYGSPSSITTQRSTLRRSARISSQRQRDRSCPSLRTLRPGRPRARAWKADAGGDDARAARSPGASTVEAAGLVPLGDLGELLAQPAVGRAGVGRDHHAARGCRARSAAAAAAAAATGGGARPSWSGRRGWSCAAGPGCCQRSEISKAASVKS